MKVLVTGAAGFIGSHIVDALRTAQVDVVGLDSLDAGTWRAPPPYLRADVTYVFDDLRAWTPGAEMDGVEAVVHCAAIGGVGRAAREPGAVLDANAGGTVRLADIVRAHPRIARVCLAGSFSVYGANYQYRVPSTGRMLGALRRASDLDAGRYDVYDAETGEAAVIQPVTTITTPEPLETYATSKLMQEVTVRALHDVDVNVLRFSSVFGPRLRLDDGEATIIARLAGWLRAGVRPRLLEDGAQIRDWVWVGDVADAMVSLALGHAHAARDAHGAVLVNACTGVPTTLRDACTHIGAAVGSTLEPDIVGGYRPGDMRHCLGDATAFAQVLGRAPRTLREAAADAFAVDTFAGDARACLAGAGA